MSGWVTSAKPSRRNTDPGVSRTFSWIFFLNKTTQNTLVTLYRKFLRKKKHSYQMFCLNLWSSWNWVSCSESWKIIFIPNFSHVSPNRFWQIFSMFLNSHPTTKWHWKKNYAAISLMLNQLFDWTKSVVQRCKFYNNAKIFVSL